jgi:tetratricopeptide (TPR) repeat protein
VLCAGKGGENSDFMSMGEDDTAACGLTFSGNGGRGDASAVSVQAPDYQSGEAQLDAQRAAASQDKGETRHAVTACDTAISLDPRNATYYRMRGRLRHLQADLDGALGDFDSAIALDPAFAAAYVDRGMARFLKTDVSGALADYDTAARLNPRQPNLHHMRALARCATGNLAGAREDLCAALHVDGETAEIYNDRGRVSMESGEFSRACADFEMAGRLRPHWPQAHSNRGWALLHSGELDGALCAFSSALALEPTDALALYGQQAVTALRGDTENSLNVGVPLISDPDIARMVAASGILPVADLAEVTSIEP